VLSRITSTSRRTLVSSIAFPAISTGIFNYPIDLAARVAISTIRAATTDVTKVRFVCFDEPTWQAYEAVLVEQNSTVHNETVTSRWRLLRQDDNGNRFDLETFDTRREAERRRTELESGVYPHRQSYWTEPS
jgi:hypothetical protein